MYLREQTESQPQQTVQSSGHINFQAYQQQYLQQLQQRSKPIEAHSLMAPPSMSQVHPPPDNLFTFQELGDNQSSAGKSYQQLMFSQVMDSADRNQRQFIVERDELGDEAYELADEEGTIG